MAPEAKIRTRNVTAVLGPTNTGKTHLAIERMLGHDTGMIGLPLRLLAREVYDKIATRVGPSNVALITGEEKIKPDEPRYWVSTVEAMPREVDVDFQAIDEVQLCADPERGHVFTDRLLHSRGNIETLLLGAGTMREAISDLIPGANFISRPRLSKLTYSGQKKITRLPARTAVVAFSAAEVYAVAELMRRQRGGAAVVMGALSPRTRNAQVELYQSGDVDYLIATDAIGMGLNLEVDHVAFSSSRKFDGQNFRQLTPVEIGQIAGRAGRHLNDGTFGVTGDVPPFDPELIERLENHTFDPVKTLQWREPRRDFTSLHNLRESLLRLPTDQRLVRTRMADDVRALEAVSADRDISERATNPAAVEKLWEVCQVPDYRKISPQNHSEMVATLYRFLTQADCVIPEDWFARQVAYADRTDGDIDTLANRIAHVRTWTFVSNRADWLQDPIYWQEKTRTIEDRLSDALHESLTQRFVDRRTSALMKGLRANEDMSADISDEGAIMVESHFVGRLKGFRFYPDQSADGIDGKAARNAAQRVLSKEFSMRARRVVSARNDALKLTPDARILWRDEEIARLEPGEDVLRPQIVLICDENLQSADQARVLDKLNGWLSATINERLKPLIDLAADDEITGLSRGIAFRICENLGSLKRDTVTSEIKSLDQSARALLRKHGIRFGAFNIYCPVLLKPAPAELTATLWTLKHGKDHGLNPTAMPERPRAGLTSAPTDLTVPEAYYRAYGFHVCGPRVIRIDILERLADLIRPLLSWRKNRNDPTETPPKGATGDGGFTIIPDMMSILGCSAEELGKVFQSLGFRSERKPRPFTDVTSSPAVPATKGAQPDTPKEISSTPAIGDQNQTSNTEPSIATDDQQATLSTTTASPPPSDIEAATPKQATGEQTPDGPTAEEASQASPHSVVDETATAPADTDPTDATQSSPPPEPAATEASTKATTDQTANTETEAAEQFIEIWRPRRRNRPQQRPKRHNETTNTKHPRTGTPGEQQRTGTAAAQARGDAAGSRDTATHRQTRDNRTTRAPAAANKRQQPPHGKRQAGPKSNRKHGPRSPARYSSKPNKQAPGADPDSPFAALGALKEALQKRTEESSSS